MITLEKLKKTISKQFDNDRLNDLRPGDSELALCNTMNIIAGESGLPLRFEIVGTDDECGIFTRIKGFGDVYLGNFTYLSAEGVADTVYNMIQERDRLQKIADKGNNVNSISV